MRAAAALMVLLLPSGLALGAAAPGATAGADELFQGFLVPASASDVYAPEFTFRVSGWNSSWGNGKLVELLADGTAVKEGAVIARFDFIAKDAKQWISDRVQKAQAEASSGRIAGDQAVEALSMERRRKEIEVRLAGLNVEKEPALSRRQAESYKIARRLSEFELDAATQRLSSLRKSKAAERAYLESAVSRAQEDQTRYEYYARRFTLLAPHDGVIRHAFNPRERRKVQKGDGLMSGQKVMSVARDEKVVVRFFVPEHQLYRVREGEPLTVTALGSAEELSARVQGIDFFPQELGFLLENEGLANGREKAFAVRAELPGGAGALAAGTEVRVRSARR